MALNRIRLDLLLHHSLADDLALDNRGGVNLLDDLLLHDRLHVLHLLDDRLHIHRLDCLLHHDFLTNNARLPDDGFLHDLRAAEQTKAVS